MKKYILLGLVCSIVLFSSSSGKTKVSTKIKNTLKKRSILLYFERFGLRQQHCTYPGPIKAGKIGGISPGLGKIKKMAFRQLKIFKSGNRVKKGWKKGYKIYDIYNSKKLRNFLKLTKNSSEMEITIKVRNKTLLITKTITKNGEKTSTTKEFKRDKTTIQTWLNKKVYG